ncbi:hypothetical protein DEJ30_13985 [Curtobacterium sp. MCPF17_003]|uniref:phage tail protein n=1 Tax=Curtobacterium sp. MCPF17_003 TaxID=2175637 RepID=UPI000D83AE39|nr:phage tail length tape measure family protein [Curtobacterium sp. MCPF17_003]PYY63353.1 hypothetical protein DEJ30_13985 [Curtobacterium sp. MCPF17_003]
MAGSSIVVSVLAETSKFKSGMDGAAGSADKFGARFGKVALAGAAAVGAITVGVGAFIRSSIDAAAESEKVAAQTAAVVKSTGGAADRSADQIGDLALKLSNLTGIDDEVIQSAENMVATFTNIKGKQFDDVTKSALDMATALGTDPVKAAQSLAKAVNDPVAGMSKLTKQGVTFSEQQKAQIKQYAEMGETGKAQAVILAEVNKEFGGSAEAFGNTFAGIKEKIANAFGNMQETIGGAFLPVLSQVGGGIAVFLQKLGESEKFVGIVQGIADAISTTLSGGGPLGVAIDFISGAFQTFGPIISQAFGPLLPVIQQIGAAFLTIAPSVSPFGIVLQSLVPVLPQLVSLIGQLAGTALTTLSTVMTALAPVLTTVANILIQLLSQVFVALMPIAVQLVTVLSSALSAIAPVFAQLIAAIAPLISQIAGLLIPIISALLPVVTTVFKAIVPIISAAMKIVQGIIQVVTGIITGNWKQVWSGIQNIVSGVWGVIKGVIVGAISIVKSVITAGLNLVRGIFSSVWGAISGVVTGAVNGIVGQARQLASGIGDGVAKAVNFVTGLQDKITSALGAAGQWLVDAGGRVIDGFVRGITNGMGAIASIASSIGNKLMSSVKGILGIHSPSREMAKLGKFSIQGFANGLSKLKPVERAMTALGKTVLSGTPELASADGLAGYAGGRQVVINTYHVNAQMLEPTPEAGRVIHKSLDDFNRRNGVRS